MSSNYVLMSRFLLKNNVSPDAFSSLKNTESTRYYLCEEQGVNELLEPILHWLCWCYFFAGILRGVA